MAGMDNLIRVQKWKLDEKRRVVSDMEDLLGNFCAQLEKLNQDQAREQEIAKEDPDAGFLYASYANAAKIRRENLLASIEDAERQVEQAREEMAEIFQELKKYEISEETRLRLQKEALDKKQQQEMDDFSIEAFRRKANNG